MSCRCNSKASKKDIPNESFVEIGLRPLKEEKSQEKFRFKNNSAHDSVLSANCSCSALAAQTSTRSGLTLLQRSFRVLSFDAAAVSRRYSEEPAATACCAHRAKQLVLWKFLNMAERVGFEKALSDRLFAFNKMPKTDVFTVTYLLSHLEHESQKKR